MSHSKGGSEDVCVNYDTSSAQVLFSLHVIFNRYSQTLILVFSQCFIILLCVYIDDLDCLCCKCHCVVLRCVRVVCWPPFCGCT